MNIKDIAKIAGVSISTVSYALNGSSRISEKTREKILAIAKELNYIPNAAGRNLKKKETKVIGAFIEDYSGAYFGKLFQGMRDALDILGYELIICSGKESQLFIPERMIDAAIILDSTFSSGRLIDYANRGHKLVVLDRELDHPNINHILLDNQKGAKIAIDFLVEKGHKKLYVIKGPDNNFDARQRLQAVRQTISNYVNVDYIEIAGDFGKLSGEQAAKQIVQEYEQPVAVFCFNDEMAIGMYNYLLKKTDFQIGKHIHIIGFDNIELSKYIQPSLSTIDYSRNHWGYLASQHIVKMIDNESVEHKIIDVQLINRKSVQTR